MNILLLGEFSGVHKNLKEGLQALGHNAVIVSTGDGWKQIGTDILLGSARKNLLLNKAEKLARLFLSLNRLKGFDAVQIVNPIIFSHTVRVNRFLIKHALRHNARSFLLVAGCDSLFYANIFKGATGFEYHPCTACLPVDKRRSTCFFDTEGVKRWNHHLAGAVDGIIPVSFSYDIAYSAMPGKRRMIHLPLNVKKIAYRENAVKGKVRFFHGINRRGFKGTPFIEEAMRRVRDKYPNDVEITISEKLPLNQYLDVLQSSNVVLDQTYGYALGMNSLYTMAAGKVVFTRFEERFFRDEGFMPAVNIRPDAGKIMESMEYVLENRHRIPETGHAAREFVEKHHDCVKIAGQYVEEWKR